MDVAVFGRLRSRRRYNWRYNCNAAQGVGCMNVLVSGLHAKLGASFIERARDSASAIQWVPVGQFTEQVTASDAGTRFKQAIWLYRPPWSLEFLKLLAATDKDIAGFLETWERDNRTALSIRDQARIPLIYVNADRGAPEQVLQPPARGRADSGGGPDGVAVLGLAASFADPPLWDVLEALEAVAHNLGDEAPLFRNTCRLDAAAFHQVIRWAAYAQDAGRLRSEMDQLRHDLGQRAAELDAERAKSDDARSEGELLLVQLHQVQEELEQYYLKYQQVQKDLSAQQKAAAAARKEAQALKARLRKTQVELEAALTPRPAVEETPTRTGIAPLRPLRRAVSRAMIRRQQKALRDRLQQSGWFDPDWYLQTYPDVRAAQVDPVQHYLSVGWRENRNPGPRFNTAFYLRSNPDVRKEGANPLVHFLEHGSREGRRPSPS